MRTHLLSAFLAAVILASGVTTARAESQPAAQAVPGPGPQEVVQQSAQAILRELDANREMYRKDPKQLRVLADKYLLPHFDSDYSARLVLGKYWRTASEAQRKRFIEAFYQSLMRNYGDAVAEFTADRLTFLPYKGDPASTQTTVRTEVKRDNGTMVPVNYSLHATPEGWKVWDVTIEGISYVKNYRTDFGSEIEAKGLDAVIQRMEDQNAAGKPDASARSGDKSGSKGG